MEKKKKEIMLAYEGIAEAYGGHRRKLWPPIKQFLDTAPENETILDIGCGNAISISKTNKKFIGMDIAFSFAKLAKTRIKNTVQADASALPFKSNSFSRIISIAVIHHLPTEKDRLNMIKEIREGNFFDNATDFYAYAEKLDLVLDGLYDKSNLPKSPDIKAINNLLIECHEQYYEQ